MRLLPGWIRGYDRAWLVPDLLAGVIVWSVVVPQAVAYAQIAGLPPSAGLAAAPGALLAYALLGTSRVASGGDRGLMRPFAEEIYGIPPERVIGSSNGLRFDPNDGGTLAYLAEPDVFDDGPAKPVGIWSRTGRRPLVAGGNSDGDVPMLQFVGGARPGLRLLVLHDDAEREFDYVTGAETVLETARAEGWTVVSVRNDWAAVFAETKPAAGRVPTATVGDGDSSASRRGKGVR